MLKPEMLRPIWVLEVMLMDINQFFEVKLQSQPVIFIDHRIWSVTGVGEENFSFTLLGSFDWFNN